MESREFFAVAVSTAKEVGAYQRSQFGHDLKIEFKGTIDIVTEVDKKSEELILKTIRQHYPEHDVLAEEGSGERKDSEYKWIIDPLDGTTNFAHGYPQFAVSIGLEIGGEIIAGVVYDPMRDELFRAFKGEGAYLNDRPIRVSHTEKLEHAMIATGFAYNIRKHIDEHLRYFKDVIMKAQAVRRAGSASLDICHVASGRFDGFWELNLFPWDTAAGVIIAKEAGAKITRFDGAPYTVYEKDILITNAVIHGEMVKTLKKGLGKRLF
ncbi:MAG: inositol monophosphatase [Deltaproteobacteria bacterium]|nr:inositol monophosphatase [Deltaproteobacteria bacterium]